jgi:hypothetical protein
MNHDYKAFLARDAIMSHSTEYIRNIEEIFGTVSPDVVTLVLESAAK